MLEQATVAARQREQLARYLAWRNEEGGMEGPQRLDTMLAAIQGVRFQWLRHNIMGKVLEVGCNWGFVTAWVGAHAGVDSNPDAIELARILAPEREFRCASAQALPFEDRAFDTVMLPDVLEHMNLHDVPGAIIETIRVARKRVLITMPDGEYDSEQAMNFKHRWLCDQETLADILRMVPVAAEVARVHPFIYIRMDLE